MVQAARSGRQNIAEGSRASATSTESELKLVNAARFQHRAEHPADPQNPDSPACPNCGGPMSVRTARSGKRAGSQFWGCCKYPDCSGIVSIDGSDGSDGSGFAEDFQGEFPFPLEEQGFERLRAGDASDDRIAVGENSPGVSFLRGGLAQQSLGAQAV